MMGGGYATSKHTSQGVANAKFVLLPNLSPFKCILTHLILYQIFNRPHGANRDVSRSLEPHLLVQRNLVISRPLRLSAPIFAAKSQRFRDCRFDHWLRSGGLLLLHLLRESRESGEDEESSDCEISDGLVHRMGPFFKMFVICFTPRLRTRTEKVTRNLQKICNRLKREQNRRFTTETHPAQRSARAASRPIAPQARQLREERAGRTERPHQWVS